MNQRKLIRVGDIMDDHYLVMDGLKTVSEALESIKEKGVRPIIIKKRHDDDEYGIVLLSDISKKVLATDRSPNRVNLYEIMAKPVLSVHSSMDVRYCARLMERFDVSVAPVVDDGRIVGMVGYQGLVIHGLLELYS